MWKKIKYYFFVVSFFGMLIGPQLIYKVWDFDKSAENSENRTLAEKPDFSLQTIETYPGQYEEYYNDHIAFKSKFIRLNQLVNYNLFHMAENDKCLLGEEDWLFFKDDYTLEDYQGVIRYSQEQVELIAGELVKVKEYYESIGVKFVVSIIPNKESVYGEYLPNKYVQFEDYTRADQIYDYLVSNTDVTVVSAKDELRSYKDDYQLYYKYDTHWNAIGAYISTNQLLEKMGYATLKPVEDITIREEGSHVGDLATMLKLTDIYYDEPMAVLEGISDVTVETIYSHPHSIVFNNKYVSNAENQEKIYVVGDSFSAEFAEYLKYAFGECTVIHRTEYKAGMAEEEDTDVVVCEVVERYMDQMANISSVFIPSDMEETVSE